MIQDLVVEIHETLEHNGIAHAFGGALALVQYAEPRGTIDIDLNVATDFADRSGLVALLGRIGLHPMELEAEWLPVAGVRFSKSGEMATLDVFFAFDQYHGQVIAGARIFPFAASSGVYPLPFLAADDLVVMKLSFNRPKDWVDIGAMIEAGTPLDTEYIAERLLRFRGHTMHPRIARLRRISMAG